MCACAGRTVRRTNSVSRNRASNTFLARVSSFVVTETASAAPVVGARAKRRTIPRLWADAVGAQRTGPGVPRRARRRLAPARLGRGRRPRPRARERASRPRRAEGRHVRAARAQQRRVGAPRLRAGADRCGGGPGLRIELGTRRGVSPRPFGGGRRRLRGRVTAGEGRARREGPPSTGARAHVPRPRRSRRARARPREREPDGARGRGGRRRRGRPLHDHLHVGHDGAAEGLHAQRIATTTRWRPSSTAWRRPTTARTT